MYPVASLYNTGPLSLNSRAYTCMADVKFLAHLLVDAGLHLPAGWLAMDTFPLAKNLLTNSTMSQQASSLSSHADTNTPGTQPKQSYALDALVAKLLPDRQDLLTDLHSAEKDVLVMRAVVDQLLHQYCNGMSLQQVTAMRYLRQGFSADGSSTL